MSAPDDRPAGPQVGGDDQPITTFDTHGRVTVLPADGPLSAPTPTELRELAARARALGADIADAHARLQTAPHEPTRRVGFRLDEAAGAARGTVAEDLDATADDLVRIRGRGPCPADWGVCPVHGATLRSTGGRCWCDATGCDRSWDYDRLGMPCTEPITHDVRHPDGSSPMCTGHADVARRQLAGAVVTPLPAGPQDVTR
jgi:hypothetical protein